MRNWLNAFSGVLLSGGGCLTGVAAQAQTISLTPSIALKNGETLELADAYLISRSCRSLLVTTPEAEILDGPPGVSVTIKQAMITPRAYDCAKPIAGGKVLVSANDIDEPSYSSMTLRIKFKTREGERQFSRVYNVSLFPR